MNERDNQKWRHFQGEMNTCLYDMYQYFDKLIVESYRLELVNKGLMEKISSLEGHNDALKKSISQMKLSKKKKKMLISKDGP